MPEIPEEPVLPEHNGDHDPRWMVSVDGVTDEVTYICNECEEN